MEVLQHDSVYERDSSPRILYGSWAKGGEVEEEGLECSVYILADCDESSHKTIEIKPLKSKEVLDCIAAGPATTTSESSCVKDRPRKQRRLTRLLRNVLRKSRGITKRQTYLKEANEQNSVPTCSTVAETLASSIHSRANSLRTTESGSSMPQSKADPTTLPSEANFLIPEIIFTSPIDVSENDRSVFEPLVEENGVEIGYVTRLDLDPADIPLIQSRLLKTGIVKSTQEFDFVPDYVSKEVIENVPVEKKEEAAKVENATHVKTGVWQVSCFEEDGTPKKPFYIVTGVSMDDRVDTKKLRKAVFAGQTNKRRPKLGLAPMDIAEELVGFQSGTMAPICHTVDMKLFLEETINCSDPKHKLNVGSGMFGKCLSISGKALLEIAKANPKGVVVCSLIRKKQVPKEEEAAKAEGS